MRPIPKPGRDPADHGAAFRMAERDLEAALESAPHDPRLFGMRGHFRATPRVLQQVRRHLGGGARDRAAGSAAGRRAQARAAGLVDRGAAAAPGTEPTRGGCMTYGTLDHVFVALLALTAPLFAVWTYRRMIAALAAGDAGARTRSFRMAIGLDLVYVAVILVFFAVAGRPVEGLVRLDWLPQGWWTGATWGVVLLACALLIAQVAAIRGNETGLSTARKQMTSVEGVLPHTPGELKLFLALQLAAGVGEEIVFRGYLLAYFDGLVGPTGAVLASTLMFGLGHAYQGAAGIVPAPASWGCYARGRTWGPAISWRRSCCTW